jgi:hypothetical protein
MEDDCGGIETNGHSSCSKRRRLKLHRILVDQLDARAGGRRVADLDDGDRRLANVDLTFHYFALLRNSDRPSRRFAAKCS